MVTRQSELLRILNEIVELLPEPQWVALVDENGLVLASVPENPPVHHDRISAMAAVTEMNASRVVRELDAGTLRFALIAGSTRQLLTLALVEGCMLSIGLGPGVSARSTFGPLSRKVPELLETLNRRFTRRQDG